MQACLCAERWYGSIVSNAAAAAWELGAGRAQTGMVCSNMICVCEMKMINAAGASICNLQMQTPALDAYVSKYTAAGCNYRMSVHIYFLFACADIIGLALSHQHCTDHGVATCSISVSLRCKLSVVRAGASGTSPSIILNQILHRAK